MCTVHVYCTLVLYTLTVYYIIEQYSTVHESRVQYFYFYSGDIGQCWRVGKRLQTGMVRMSR